MFALLRICFLFLYKRTLSLSLSLAIIKLLLLLLFKLWILLLDDLLNITNSHFEKKKKKKKNDQIYLADLQSYEANSSDSEAVFFFFLI